MIGFCGIPGLGMRPGIPGTPEARMTLVEALQMFNRKERYWLIRNALGENSEKLDLDFEFRNSLKKELPIDVPEAAWWAMDYHLDRLVGALHLFNCQGEETAHEKPIDNKQNLFNGTIQDIDFIVAFDNILIFIKAKGDAAWDCNQLNSKIDRLQNIAKEFKCVETHFILMSPKPPQKKRMKSIKQPRMDWIFSGDKPRWLPLQIKDEHNLNITGFDDFYRVERRNKKNTPCKDGEFLLVKKT